MAKMEHQVLFPQNFLSAQTVTACIISSIQYHMHMLATP